ncbi:MAG: gamma-glutamyl-gamma-aminobutyrate hydrolase family protein [Firmicutes bacterium]|nr:gamma-glutamyl-gamma-aminobutyrate hydrolase family protein [Bacillota bacterium]
MRPVIGITCRRVTGAGTGVPEYRLAAAYITAVEEAGGIPLLLPALAVRERLPAAACHGLLFSGGGDPDPQLYGEEELFPLDSVDRHRDAWEIFLVREALRHAIPVFGICRGLQITNVALGGSLYQDLPAQLRVSHRQEAPAEKVSHRVWVEEGTLLARIIKRKRIWTNSLHHQAVKEPAPGLIVAARSGDGVVEALEAQDGPFLLAVQWHPERLKSPGARRLFKAFICSAAARAGFSPLHLDGY